MKSIILMAASTLFLGAVVGFIWHDLINHPRPAEILSVRDLAGEQAFRNKAECTGGEAYQSYCTCTLDYMLAAHTPSELATFKGDQMTELMQAASTDCTWALW